MVSKSIPPSPSPPIPITYDGVQWRWTRSPLLWTTGERNDCSLYCFWYCRVKLKRSSSVTKGTSVCLREFFISSHRLGAVGALLAEQPSISPSPDMGDEASSGPVSVPVSLLQVAFIMFILLIIAREHHGKKISPTFTQRAALLSAW
jgi:hypothetical protein